MSIQQDIYAAGSENRPPMLNKENYVLWSSRLLCYAKSRPNGKLIYNSIMNGPYVRRMIPEPGDPACTVPVTKTFHEQTNDELTEAEIKQMEADDQAIQTILLGLPEDIYAVVDSCETAQEIWFTSTDRESIESYYHRFSKLMNDFKRNKHFPKKIASNLKFMNNLQPEWSRHVTIVYQTKDLHTTYYTQLYEFLKYNQKEVDELRAERHAKTHDPLALMANSNNSFKYPVFHPYLPSSSTYIQQPLPNNNNYIPQPSFNQNYMQQPMPNLEDITDPTTAMNMTLALMAKAFKLNYSTPTNNNQRISFNPRNRQIAQPGNQVVQNAVQNSGVQNVGNQNRVIIVLGIAHQNGNGNVVAARAEDQGEGMQQTQLLIAQKEEVGIQLQAEEFDLMAAAAGLNKIEEVNANYILMANLQQASTSGTQTDKAPVYDSDGSTEVQLHNKCYNDEIFNMFTQEEQYTELLEPIPEPHQVPHNDSNVVSEVSSVEQGKQITTLNEEISNLSKQLSKEKSTVSSLQEEKKRLKSDFKMREDELLDKQIDPENKIKKLDNILVKTGQSIQTMHMLSPKSGSFYHSEHKMDLGYQNPCYLKQAQQKQQSLYNGKVLLEKHDPPTVYDSEETLELAQERVFVSQTAKSREELYISNTFKTANVSKSISILNEEFSDDTTPSVARIFLNEVKSTIVTLQRVVKQKMTLDIHNWSSSAHQEIHKIVKDEISPIVNQVDARVQNFEIQFLKEAAKFVRDFQSLANEADESLAKHKALELKIERLLRAVISQDIMSIVQNNSVVDTSNLQTELDRTKERLENCIIKKENEYAKLWSNWYKKCEECKYDKILYDKAYNDMQQNIERLQAQLGDLKGKCKDTPCVSDTLDPLPQKLENENVELEFQVRNYEKEIAHLKTTYKNLFDSINATRTQTKLITDSLQNKLHDMIYENAKLRAQLFDKVSDQKDTSKVTSNSVPTTKESKVVDYDKVISPGMFRIDPRQTSRKDNFMPNKPSKASVRTNSITVSQPYVIIKKAINADSNGFSSIGVDITTKTRRPHPRSNTKNDRVPSASKSSRIMNKEVELEDHLRNLLLSKNKKHMSSECNNIKLAIQNDKSKIVCAMCKQCLIMANHDACVLNYVNGMNSCRKKQKTNVSNIANQTKHKAQIWKPKNVGHKERLTSPKPSKPRMHLRVYFVEGLRHNLFSVGQFCDSYLEVAFRRNTCFIRILKGVDLLKENCTTNLYTINLHDMAYASPIYLMARTTSTKSWLWHQRLSHLNFETINNLARNNLVTSLPKFKYHTEHLCPSCEQGKSKRASHPPKPVPNSKQRSKDEAPEEIKTFLKRITVLLQAPVIIVRTDNDTEFKNQVLQEYFKSVRISHQASFVRTPQQNGVVERRNCTLVEAARTMLIFSRASLFLWAEAIATACYTQNRSIIHCRFDKTPYELINGRKPDISFLYVFGALCYPKNDHEDIGKFGAKGALAFSLVILLIPGLTNLKPGLQSLTSEQISSGLDLPYAPSTITTQRPTEGELDLLFEAMYDDHIGGQPSAAPRTIPAAKAPQVLKTLTATTTTADTAPTPTNSLSQATSIPSSSQNVDELKTQQQHGQPHPALITDNVPNAIFDDNSFVNPFATPSTSAAELSSS
ncbi:retrovirus-related pol polyprotein from transposon TNT 1-94 [Tanacetum coccineum]